MKVLNAFSKICTDVIEKYGPSKKRYFRANHKSFIEPDTSKAIMRRTRLTYCFLEKKSDKK